MQGIAAPLHSSFTHRAGSAPAWWVRAAFVALATTAFLFVTAPAQATSIYKSVDERGNVQFSQTPPKDRPSEAVEAGGSAPAPTVSREETQTEETSTAEDDRASDPTTEVKVFDREKARETCRQAQEQREAVANSGNQLMVQDEDGKYQPMSESQRNERLERLDTIIEEACSAAEE